MDQAQNQGNLNLLSFIQNQPPQTSTFASVSPENTYEGVSNLSQADAESAMEFMKL